VSFHFFGLLIVTLLLNGRCGCHLRLPVGGKACLQTAARLCLWHTRPMVWARRVSRVESAACVRDRAGCVFRRPPSRCFGPARPGVQQSRTAGAVCGLVWSRLVSSPDESTRRSATCHSSTPRGPWSSRQHRTRQEQCGLQHGSRMIWQQQHGAVAAAWREWCRFLWRPKRANARAAWRQASTPTPSARRSAGPAGNPPHGPTLPGPRFEIAGRARAVRCRVQLPVCDEIRAVWRQNPTAAVGVHARLFSCRVVSCPAPVPGRRSHAACLLLRIPRRPGRRPLASIRRQSMASSSTVSGTGNGRPDQDQDRTPIPPWSLLLSVCLLDSTRLRCTPRRLPWPFAFPADRSAGLRGQRPVRGPSQGQKRIEERRSGSGCRHRSGVRRRRRRGRHARSRGSRHALPGPRPRALCSSAGIDAPDDQARQAAPGTPTACDRSRPDG
jgi:hypothetical protein